MNAEPSPNTQAILLLTAPLITGRSRRDSPLLTPSEYRKLAVRLHSMQAEPADLLESGSAPLVEECGDTIDANRLKALLGRGFLLSQAIDRWRTRAIWVLSRADDGYPRRLRERLRNDAPALLYGCGEQDVLQTGGLAIVGSRHVGESLLEYTREIASQVANARHTVISGAAKGVDQAAMNAALDAGGNATGVLAGNLERAVMNRDHRNFLLEQRLVLVSPYDPGAGFQVGYAMQRNKTIYALADAALVVDATVEKGGTWAGAVEQLRKYSTPVYVRSTLEPSAGLEALRHSGARPWPSGDCDTVVETVLDAARRPAPPVAAAQGDLFGKQPVGRGPARAGSGPTG